MPMQWQWQLNQSVSPTLALRVSLECDCTSLIRLLPLVLLPYFKYHLLQLPEKNWKNIKTRSASQIVNFLGITFQQRDHSVCTKIY